MPKLWFALADGERRGGVLADAAQRRLVLPRRRVLQPEQVVGLQVLAQARRLNGCHAVVAVVQQRQFGPELVAYGFEDARHVAQVGAGVPDLLGGAGGALLLGAAGRFVVVAFALSCGGGRDAVHGVEAGDAALDADGAVARLQVGVDGVDELGDVAAGGVTVGEGAGAGGAAEQLVQRHVRGLGLDVPQGGVHGGDGSHGDRAAPPVGTPVEVLPGVLDGAGVAADEQRGDVVAQVGGDGQFAAVEGGDPEAGEPVVGGDAERDEVAAGAGDEGVGGGDLHAVLLAERADGWTLRREPHRGRSRRGSRRGVSQSVGVGRCQAA